MPNWLTLQEYSVKYKVSISTLRRRIKAQDLEYKFKNGRYLIKEEESGQQLKEGRSFQELQSLYQKILIEKEDRINKLEGELEDAKNLLRLLEGENSETTADL